MIESDWINYENYLKSREPQIKEDSVDIKDKYLLTVQETALLFNIGERTIRAIVASHPKGDFYLRVGKKLMIKKDRFLAFVNKQIRL